ncbi:hypothetical protein [Oligoflexus tunisiensis]|uniref:hypothetical protein n=1 Tax=Oligoflexus tunisiensis TaxID=708132 RepID=UPI00114CC508|nr:hypothetical protein [Oligoflexus tunisiensis]
MVKNISLRAALFLMAFAVSCNSKGSLESSAQSQLNPASLDSSVDMMPSHHEIKEGRPEEYPAPNPIEVPENASPMTVTPNPEELVVPPSQIAGTYFTGKIIAKETVSNSAKMLVGVAAFKDNILMSTDPDRFTLTYALPGELLTPNVSANFAANSIGKWDRVIEIHGPSLVEIEASFDRIVVAIRIVERVNLVPVPTNETRTLAAIIAGTP